MMRTMPSMTTYKRGQVVVVEVPYSDVSGTKRRPALVVSAEAFHRNLADVLVCPISSQPRYHRTPGTGDCPLRDWRLAGLRHPSTVRVSKLLAVDKQIVRKAIGTVAPDDLSIVTSTIRRAFDLHRKTPSSV